MVITSIVVAYENGEISGLEAVELAGRMGLLCLYEMAADELPLGWDDELANRVGAGAQIRVH